MPDQAESLRNLVWRTRQRARVIAVTSGKGGVGKTSTSVNLAIALAQRGRRTVLLDADLGLANVEVLMGLNSLYNLQHVIDGEKGMLDILVRAPGGLEIVPGTSGLAHVADLDAPARERVLAGLQQLQEAADFIVLDTMAGIGQNAVSFCLAADEVLLVTTPEPSAIVDAYAMIKTIYTRREDALVRLLVNQVASDAQAQAVAAKLQRVTFHYLERNLSLLGAVPRDVHVGQAVMRSEPFVLRFPQAPASRALAQLAERLDQAPNTERHPPREGFLRRFAQSFGLAS